MSIRDNRQLAVVCFYVNLEDLADLLELFSPIILKMLTIDSKN